MPGSKNTMFTKKSCAETLNSEIGGHFPHQKKTQGGCIEHETKATGTGIETTYMSHTGN